MDTLTRHDSPRADHPTEGAPEYGALANHGVIISTGVYWVEDDGTHVFRSLEFDVQGEGNSKKAAFSTFVDNLEDFAVYLSELTQGDQATQHECEVLAKLAERYFEVNRRCGGEKVRLVAVNWPWGRSTRQHGRDWHSQTKNSSLVLHA